MTDTGSLPAGVETGVGLTALMVAAARAIESHRGDALASDLYAEHFVRAAQASTHWPVHPNQVPDGDANPLWGRLGRYFGLRTRVLDDFVHQSIHAGAGQTVILGAGLDTRAFRLDWPPGHVAFELDRQEVLDFKHEVLGALHATAKTTRIPISIDLDTEWAGSLIDAGFNPDIPSAWLAEGLLLYLSSTAEEHLIATIDRLSAEASTLAYEVKLGTEQPAVRDSPVYTSTKHQIGVDLLALFDPEPRPDSAAELEARGWSTTISTPFEFTRRHGRGPHPEPDDALASNRWVFADKPRAEDTSPPATA